MFSVSYPKLKAKDNTQLTAGIEQSVVKKPANMFRVNTEEKTFSLDSQSNKSKNKSGQFKDAINLGGNYSVNLAHFFFLPKFDKTEAEQILAEIRKDSESIWTPSKLVQQLNRHIVSQDKAKRIIAQAVRNKYRMTQIEGEIRDSMRPSNILVFGRSGSGKTEIFRRIAKIYNAPFLRVEATKYTEVGYHGDDITNIITDLFKKTQAELAMHDG